MKKKAVLSGLFSVLGIFCLPIILSLTGEIPMTLPLGNLKWIFFIIVTIAVLASFTMGYQFYLYYIQQQKINVMKKKAIASGLFVGLAYIIFQLFVLEQINPVPESIGNYKWIAYLFIFIIHATIGYYSYSYRQFSKQKELAAIHSEK